MIHTMLQYIAHSPECYHAAHNLAAMLEGEGYVRLWEGPWKLEPGGKYFVMRDDSALVAFRLPQSRPDHFLVAASHLDSPCFRVRETGALDGAYTRLSVEPYGGLIHSCWLDRPLSVAGRVVVRNGNRLERRLVDLKRDTLVIPNVAIHLNREMNQGVRLDPARDLQPLYGGKGMAGTFRRELADGAGCREEDLLATDLFVYNNQPGTIWGPEREFVSAPRLDALSSIFCCAQGFLLARETEAVPVLAAFNHEEIGSETKSGAASGLLPDTLRAIAAAYYPQSEMMQSMLSKSMMLSCDNGHGLHPNHPELADQAEAPVLNGGVVIKHSPRYATDAFSSAVFSQVCAKAGVPVQHYSNRPDQAGGSTLGNISNTATGMWTVDIGLAQLAMHSCFETMGARDVESLIQAAAAFYGSGLRLEADGAVLEA